MAVDRYVVLGLGAARAPWFRSVAQWTNAAALPAEFVKCVSAEELRARLSSGRPFSAVLIDAALPALDLDLVAAAHAAGCAVLVVDDARGRRDWTALGADAVLAPWFERGQLLDALAAHAAPVGRADAPVVEAPALAGGWRGQLVAVCGSGGTGASTVAAALAQGLAADVRRAGLVLLADFVRHGEQAMLHDSGDVVPGVQELVEAFRSGRPSADEVRGFTWSVDDRGYHLLLGLRRARHWSALRPRAVEAAVDALRRAFRVVVCDVDADWEGEAQGGSLDVEERNALSRTATLQADAVLVVGLPGMKGVHALARVVDELLAVGVPPERVVPVVNRAPRRGRARDELMGALRALVPAVAEAADPVFLPERRVEDAFRDGVRLPVALSSPVAAAFTAVADRHADDEEDRERAPVLVRPGTLGHYADEGEDDAAEPG